MWRGRKWNGRDIYLMTNSLIDFFELLLPCCEEFPILWCCGTHTEDDYSTLNLHTYTHTHTHTYTHIHTHTHTHTYTHIHTHTWMHTHKCTHAHIHIYTMHTHMEYLLHIRVAIIVIATLHISTHSIHKI